MNARLAANGSVTSHLGVLEWCAILTIAGLLVGAMLRQESRMTRVETISENVVKVLDRLDANTAVVKRVEASVSKIPERGENAADHE